VTENVKKKRVIFKAKLLEIVESLGGNIISHALIFLFSVLIALCQGLVKPDVDVSGIQKIQLLLTPQQIAVNK